MNKFRIFFAVIFIVFGSTFYVFLPEFAPEIRMHSSDLGILILTFILALTSLNALAATFFRMRTVENTGETYMERDHLLYSWMNRIISDYLKMAHGIAPKYIKEKEWSGKFSGCSVFCFLIPIAMVEMLVLILLPIVFSAFWFAYSLLTGDISMKDATNLDTGGVWITIFMIMIIQFFFLLLMTPFSKRFPRFASCYSVFFLLEFIAIILFVLAVNILSSGILTVLFLGLFFLVIALALALIVASTWITSYLFYKSEKLRKTPFGQLTVMLKAKICPVGKTYTPRVEA